MSKDFFAHKASAYEQNPKRVNNVDNIAQTIINHTPLQQDMHLMDFGAGTGLLLERIAPHVKKITAVDISESMIEVLENKREQLACDLNILKADLESESLTDTFDGIISSMTMHHIKDVEAMFKKLFLLVKAGGFIAIADLDQEDGSFHTEDTGVHHFGFERTAIARMATAAGFREVTTVDASIIEKPQGEFGVFLLSGKR